jgi:GMP synthase (glutamine-hydrolysing)
MKPILIVTHLEDRHPGLARESLQDAGCPVIQVDSVDGNPPPPIDAHEDPFLACEVSLMADALEAGIPVLGMCLGAQLLAVAGGGVVTAMGRMVAGWPELSLLPAAAQDPVFGALPDDLPVLKWHEDEIAAPPGAVALGTTPGPGAALFRLGSRAWGSQAHLELTPSLLIDTWLAEPGGAREIEDAGHPIAAFREESARRLVPQMAAARPMFTRFAALARSR